MKEKELIYKIAQKVADKGGRMYFVGGMVRDEVMNDFLKTNYTNKDLDTETFGISVAEFKEILSEFGSLNLVGESFGVFKIDNYDIDFAMPRTERQTGAKHIDFEVSVNPFLSLEEATLRRDFTINQLMKDILSGEIIDCHSGIADIKRKIIRHINDETFQEDALRVFRAAQFSARFNFEISKKTLELSKEIDVSNISFERVDMEFYKALTKSEKPSIFFKQLKAMNHLEEFFTFNKQVEENLELLDKAKQFSFRTKYSRDFLLTILFYKVEPVLALESITKLTNHNVTLDMVYEFTNNINNFLNISTLSPKNRRLFLQKLKFLNEMFLYGELLGMDTKYLEEIREDYEKVAKVPLIRGRNLISLGFQPSPRFTDLLKLANELQCEGKTKEEILKELVKH